MTKTTKKIAIRGAYGEQNFGDDALMYYLYYWSQKNDLDVTFFGVENNYLKFLFPNLNFKTKKEEYKYRNEILVLGGGTQFFSFSSPSKTQKFGDHFVSFVKSPLLFFKKLKVYLANKFLKKIYLKTYAVGIGLGPFLEGSFGEENAIKHINIMTAVLVRDQLSFEFSKNLNNNVHHYTDICFLPGVIDFSVFKKKRQKIHNIGIIVRDWNHDENGREYYGRLENEIKNLKDQKKEYCLTYILFKDEKYWEERLCGNNEKFIKWDPKTQSVEDFLKILSDFDVFISARFHGIIFAGLLGIPSIAIEVEQKLNLVNEYFFDGIEVWKQPFNDSLIDIIGETQKKYDSILTKLNKGVEINSKKANDMFEFLLKDIL